MGLNLKYWLNVSRAYSFPMSIMSFLVPFIFGIADGGNIFWGIIAGIGIIFAHAGVNMFDDFVDFFIAQKLINTGMNINEVFQRGKCSFLLDKSLSIKKFGVIIIVCFTLAISCGIFLGLKTGNTVFVIMFISAILGLLYPVLTFIALGEITVGIIFAPLLYIGVYYVMTQSFSKELIPLAISTGLLTIGLLHAHMFLDYDFDKKNRKITLCSLAGSKENAVKTQMLIFIFAFGNIILQSCIGSIFANIGIGLAPVYLLCLLSYPTAYILIDLMCKDINGHKEAIKPNILFGPLENLDLYEKLGNKDFMIKFMVARNVMVEFTIFICIAKIISELI
ncbi:prenyltransferase [bacterium]|nr:prenyltransferase [bacterium]